MAAPAGASKQDIRERIWDYMESHDLADFPRPVHHRIPNFKGASQAAEHLSHLQAFSKARTVKVNPDAPQRNARFLVLENKKTLLVPTPRLRTGLFNRITPPPGASKDVLRKCATSQGVRNFSVPVGLDASVQVDLVVVGSVAVSEKGWRIGKGEGYADLEYAMMVSMGAVHEGTPVVTIVHDCQVVDIPETLLEDHDLTVDYIITPTRVIATGCARPKPVGIVWSKVSYEMLEKIPILRSLCEREKQAGKDVSLPTEPSSQPPAPRSGRRPWGVPRWQRGSGGRPRSPPKEEDTELAATVCLGNLPRDARMSELKRALLWLGAAPMNVTWQEAQRRAILHYPDPAAARQAVNCLQGLRLGANTLKVYWGSRGTRVLVGGPQSKSHGHYPWGF